MNLHITKEDRIQVVKVLERFKRPKSKKDVFYNLCFAICAPQTKFQSNLKVQEKLLAIEFYEHNISFVDLSNLIKEVRFKGNKARYLMKAKEQFDSLYSIIMDVSLSEDQKRDLIVKLQPGLGMKTASHFLRNLGYNNFAVIDTHILKYLGAAIPTSTVKYKEIERVFRRKSKKWNMTPAEFDAVIWKKSSDTPWQNFIY